MTQLQPSARLRTAGLAWRALAVVAVLGAAGLAWWAPSLAAAAGPPPHQPAVVQGGGTTIIEGGMGAPSFAPVMTRLAFHWSGGRGHFECLALKPSAPAGSPGSGDFDRNVMYVTGTITSVEVSGGSAVLQGTATVTGLGAGSNVPFAATVTSGGPGSPVVLQVSGHTFHEMLVDGHVAV